MQYFKSELQKHHSKQNYCLIVPSCSNEQKSKPFSNIRKQKQKHIKGESKAQIFIPNTLHLQL